MSFISRIHAELRRARLTQRNASRDSAEAPMGVHKSYDRMERIALPAPETIQMTLSDAILRRASTATLGASSLSLPALGTLLGTALGRHGDSHKRHYPSGGGLYPVETYIVSESMPQMPPSVFHYNPTDHVLEVLWDLPAGVRVHDLYRNDHADTLASTVIIFTSVWRRSSKKYGDFSYILGLLEAGHMSENILLCAAALGVAACPLGRYDDQAITRLLDIDADEEQPVHMIAIQ